MSWAFNFNSGLLNNANSALANSANGAGTTPVSGWNTFSNVLGGISGLAGAFTGFKQLGLAKDQFNWQKGAFNTNLVNQANLVNSQLEDRQRRRQMSDSNAIPVAEYMQKFGAASSVQEAQQRQQQNQNAWNKSQGMNKLSAGG